MNILFALSNEHLNSFFYIFLHKDIYTFGMGLLPQNHHVSLSCSYRSPEQTGALAAMRFLFTVINAILLYFISNPTARGRLIIHTTPLKLVFLKNN